MTLQRKLPESTVQYTQTAKHTNVKLLYINKLTYII